MSVWAPCECFTHSGQRGHQPSLSSVMNMEVQVEPFPLQTCFQVLGFTAAIETQTNTQKTKGIIYNINLKILFCEKCLGFFVFFWVSIYYQQLQLALTSFDSPASTHNVLDCRCVRHDQITNVLGQYLTLYLWLTWNFLCRPQWPLTQRDKPGFAI